MPAFKALLVPAVSARTAMENYARLSHNNYPLAINRHILFI